MTHAAITAVFFDWDLTLARAIGDISYSQRLTALFKHVGLVYTPAEVAVAVEEVLADHDPDDEAKVNPQTRRDIINHYYRILGQLGFQRRDWAFGNRIYEAYGYLPTYLYEDTLPVLETLKQRGYKLGIVSNHAISARALIESNLGDLIPSRHIIISQEIGIHKPARSIFRHALRQIGEPAERCVFVGNSYAVDALAAVTEGDFKLGLWLDRENNGNHRTMPDRVRRITSLYQILDLLA